MTNQVYQIVTDRIIKKLEEGVIPWRMPWVAGKGAVNYVSQKAYRGINAMLLEPGEYATFKQITEAGGKVNKGAKSEIVVFYKLLIVDNEEADDKANKFKKIPYLRYYRVFNIDQCTGIESKRPPFIPNENNPIESAEAIMASYTDKPKIEYASGRAFYNPIGDRISVPPIEDYKIAEEFYSTMFHEMVHSTGHTKRLNRAGVAQNAAAFGSETYSKEELVAEIGAAMLCGISGIENYTIDNSASYIDHWLGRLKEDNKMIVGAASAAQKAADYIRGIKEAKAE